MLKLNFIEYLNGSEDEGDSELLDIPENQTEISEKNTVSVEEEQLAAVETDKIEKTAKTAADTDGRTKKTKGKKSEAPQNSKPEIKASEVDIEREENSWGIQPDLGF